MERSKKPLCLTGANFFELSLKTFMSVINSSYSYFTLMQNLYANSQ